MYECVHLRMVMYVRMYVCLWAGTSRVKGKVTGKVGVGVGVRGWVSHGVRIRADRGRGRGRS